MNNQLTVEHLAAYLPYGVKVEIYEHVDTVPNFRIDEVEMICDELISFKGRFTSDWYFDCDENEIDIKLVLRPLSDLTKVIEHNGERFVPVEKVEEMYGYEIPLTSKGKIIEPIRLLPYIVIRQFLEWHLDIFQLLDKNLAININTLNK